MTTVSQDGSALGTKVVKLQEEYEGIPVFDGVVTIRTDSAGHPTGDASGRIVQNIAEDLPDVESRLTNEKTLEIAIKSEGDQHKKDRIGDVKYKEMIYVDKQNKAHLVNHVTYLIDSVKRPNYIIDLKSGEVLGHWNSLDTFKCRSGSGEGEDGPLNFTCGDVKTYRATGGNAKLGKINYGTLPHCLNMTIVDDLCYLENEYVQVVDMNFTKDENFQDTASFTCEKGYGDKINEAYSPAVDAFFYGTMVHQMFQDWFGSPPLPDKIVIRVHWGYLYENAFWNGVNTTFGDGGYRFFPLTVHDIVGHEIGHGVTEFGSGLLYYGESGGVNEAFSDMLGEASEHYLTETDFFTGAFATKSDPWLRSFETPEADGESIRYASNMTSWMDPHYSSGVFRRAFYVTVVQEGLSIRDAMKVYLHANRNYWHPSGTFYDCSCGVLKAAIDLGISQVPFKRGFSDVGIEPCDASSHIFTLVNNVTQPDVLVSSSIRPIFRFEAPWWADDIIITALSDTDTIHIAAQHEQWDDEDSAVVEDDTSLCVNAADFAQGMFLQLSSASNVTSYVQVTAGYTSSY